LGGGGVGGGGGGGGLGGGQKRGHLACVLRKSETVLKGIFRVGPSKFTQ